MLLLDMISKRVKYINWELFSKNMALDTNLESIDLGTRIFEGMNGNYILEDGFDGFHGRTNDYNKRRFRHQ